MRKPQIGPYHIVQLPPARCLMIHMLHLSGQRRSMYGLLEVDVTMARRFIADHKTRTGETRAPTGYVIRRANYKTY